MIHFNHWKDIRHAPKDEQVVIAKIEETEKGFYIKKTKLAVRITGKNLSEFTHYASLPTRIWRD